jgi:hypothetical protein
MKFFALCLAVLLLCWPPAGQAEVAQPPAPAPPVAPSVTPPGPAPSPSLTFRNCVNANDVEIELRLGRHPAGPQILATTYFLPARGTADIVLSEPFKEGTPYLGYIERTDRSASSFLRVGDITATKIPEDHSLIKKGLAEKTDTLLTLRIPERLGGLWRSVTLYIYTCRSATGPTSPKSVSVLNTRVSSPLYSSITVWLVVLSLYAFAALAYRTTDAQAAKWYRYLDPVYLTAGADGRGSLAKLQILYFSLIVAGVLGYIVARTGVLSDISTTVLMLLGIAGVGSTAAKAMDSQRNKLDIDNGIWLKSKGWLPAAGLSTTNKARWRDIITSEGEFDVYRYQNCLFSLIVGIALLTAGISELASFTIPETLLGILGLSQVIYVGGKLVTQASVSELNAAIANARAAEDKFREAAAATGDPNPAAGGTVLDAAKRRAGEPSYSEYMRRADSARILFESLTGQTVNPARLEPRI